MFFNIFFGVAFGVTAGLCLYLWEQVRDTRRCLRQHETAIRNLNERFNWLHNKFSIVQERVDMVKGEVSELAKKQSELEETTKERAEQEQRFYEGVNNILDYGVEIARKAGDE